MEQAPDPFSAREAIDAYQEQALRQAVSYVISNSPFYRRKFATLKAGQPFNFTELPVTVKQELQEQNMDFLCVPNEQIIEYCTTSGTLGYPVTLALTENDLQRLAYNEWLSFTEAGLSADDTLLLMLSLDRQFMAGIAYYLGARQLGAGIIRGGPGNFAFQANQILRSKPTALVAVPSFIAGLVSYAAKNDLQLNDTSVKKIICIGENIRNEDFTLNALGQKIADHWNVQLYSTYASTEQQTAFTECGAGTGGHLHFGLLYCEILDGDNKPVPAGTYGELTITTLGVEGMPLIRYKTGDICALHPAPCACGRSSPRISPVRGRKEQLIKYKGTTLYPQTIFNVLNQLAAVTDYVVHLYRNETGTDELRLHLAVKDLNESTHEQIRLSLQSSLRVIPEIIYLPLGEIQKMQILEGKRKIYRFVDLRTPEA